MKRIFFAAPLDEPVRAQLRTLIRELKQKPGNIKWVNPEHTHLTLKFVGETADEHISEYQEVLERSALPAPFTINTGATGIFPHPRKPRVLWVGMGEDPALTELADTVDKVLAGAGVDPDTRSFHPHLTVGRAKDRRLPRETVESFLDYEIKPIPLHISHITCFESHLKPTGAEYSPLFEVQLNP